MATSRLLFIAATALASSLAFSQAPTPAAGSGLVYKSLKDGSGASPAATDVVRVHYRGTLQDGKEFDSSHSRGQPAEFPLNRVIKGWTEGVQLMKVGDQMRFWIPSDLAYGDKPKRPGAPAGMLVFDIELIEVKGVK